MRSDYGVIISVGYRLEYYRSQLELVWFADVSYNSFSLRTYTEEPQYWIGIL
jgi:hypothetical protein